MIDQRSLPSMKDSIGGFKKCITFLLILLLFSCSSPSTATKKGDGASKIDEKGKVGSEVNAEGDRILEKPEPGDIKVIDGVEYIYARNRKFMMNPYEPENVWVRKDQYAPGLSEVLMSYLWGTSEKERRNLEARIAKLEEENKKRGIPPAMAYPPQTAQLPAEARLKHVMKRRVIVLLVADRTGYRGEELGELATRRLVSRLENTGVVICMDPGSVRMKDSLTTPPSLGSLSEMYGVQAVLAGTLSGTPDSFRLDIDLYNTETGTILRQFSVTAPVVTPGAESARADSVGMSADMLVGDLVKNILTIDWYARIASVENSKIFINAGRLSGLEVGSALEVYSPGQQVRDSRTGLPMGKTRGIYKGDLKISELFGIDASQASPVKGGGFEASDLVYLKKR